MVVRVRLREKSSGPLDQGLSSGSRNISIPASSLQTTRGFPPSGASRATIPTGAPPLTYSVLFFSSTFAWTPKLSFGSLRSGVKASRQRSRPVATSTAAATAPSAPVLPAAV